MRIRLLAFALLAFCQLHLQQSGVLGQKYYMNFAFNNNNPDGGSGEANGGAHPDTPDAGTPENHDTNEGHSNMIPPDTKSGEHGKAKSHEEVSNREDVTHGVDHESKESSDEEAEGFDIDDDDSDSKDPPGRRERERQISVTQGVEQKDDHNHHSSYEISIDDSFGGRYVRSIYESSESLARLGSFGGSSKGVSGGHGGIGEGDSDSTGDSYFSQHFSGSGQKKDDKGDKNINLEALSKLYDNDDYEELN